MESIVSILPDDVNPILFFGQVVKGNEVNQVIAACFAW